jgi:hypothetical protein
MKPKRKKKMKNYEERSPNTYIAVLFQENEKE